MTDKLFVENLYVENLSALWATDPALAEQLDAIDDADHLSAEPAKSGLATLAVTAPDGRRIYLHSRYDPAEEADRLVNKVGRDSHELFVLGMGLGHHVARLREQRREATLWVFEPDLRVIIAALGVIDVSSAILDRKLRIIAKPEKGKLFADWMPQLAAMAVGHQIVEHAPSVQLHADFFAGVRGLVEEFLAFGKTTINTLLVNSRRTCENLAENIPWYVASPGVGRLKNAMAGQPAIIVAAGPSLRKNKHLLPQAAGKAVIISVQTSFQQLLDIGVEPHFVTSLDYHDICTQFFQKVAPTVRTELIAEPKATPKIFELNPGPVSLLGNEFVERLLREMKLDRPRLPAGATVAHLAFYLAEHLGCNPIIFVGQDLGFSEGLAYAPGTSYDDMWRPELGRFNSVEMMQWQRIVRDRAILRRVPDYQGRQTYTEERLFTYLQQFERDFLKSDRRIIDATEGGVAKRGTTPMTLADALSQYCQAPLGTQIPQHEGLDWSRLSAAADSLRTRRDEAVEIEQISAQTLPLLQAIRDALPDQAKINALIARIDPLRSRMGALSLTYEQITQFMQQSELDRYAADRRIAAAGVDGVEKQKRQTDRDIANVEHIITASAAYQALMSGCLETIDAFIARGSLAEGLPQ
ncbi:MAG: motility associated factor glycosyltransferase family protein [Burkholderiales bacterium]|nr:motility associated factor glycosyltransferase family protein [Phycisphaerae bacterium]